MLNLISFVVAIGILIFVHEFGHFIFAKLFRVGVEKFSLGFGPKLIGKQIGETEYLLSAIPLGGYVKMVGEADDTELSEIDKARSFAGKQPWQRIVIAAAGPMFNLLFSWLVFVIIFMIGFPTPTSKITVLKDKPAARAGMKDNDVVTTINGKPIRLWDELASAVLESKGQLLIIKVRRNGADFEFQVNPDNITDKNVIGETITRPAIGVTSTGETEIERVGPAEAIVRGSTLSWNITKMTMKALKRLALGLMPVKGNLGGPLSIADMAGKQASSGPISFFGFLGGLSINLAILNLLPIPILDGGHIAFNLWEVVFRRPVSLRNREIAQQIGLAILLALILLTLYLDVDKYIFKLL